MKFKNRTLLGIICIGVAIIICFVMTPIFNATQTKKVKVVRVAREIQGGNEITRDDIEVIQVGNYNLPEGVLKKEADVVGKYANLDMAVGDYIFATKVSDVATVENGYLYNLDGKKQAMSVSVTFTSGLSGKLKSGDIVSVIAPDDKKSGSSAVLPELKYVEVIAVTSNSGNDTDGQKSNEEEKELPSSVTLLVSEEQSKILAELELENNLHMTLVFRGGKETADKFIKEQDKALEKAK